MLICFAAGLIPVGIVVKDIAIGAEDLGWDSRAGQIGHCRQQLATVAKFLCCPDA